MTTSAHPPAYHRTSTEGSSTTTPSPRGKGCQLVLPSVGVRWWDGGLGRCGHRPLRNGGGTYLYRKSDFCPHSSSGPPGHLPPGGRDRLESLAEPSKSEITIHYSLFTIPYFVIPSLEATPGRDINAAAFSANGRNARYLPFPDGETHSIFSLERRK